MTWSKFVTEDAQVFRRHCTKLKSPEQHGDRDLCSPGLGKSGVLNKKQRRRNCHMSHWNITKRIRDKTRLENKKKFLATTKRQKRCLVFSKGFWRESLCFVFDIDCFIGYFIGNAGKSYSGEGKDIAERKSMLQGRRHTEGSSSPANRTPIYSLRVILLSSAGLRSIGPIWRCRGPALTGAPRSRGISALVIFKNTQCNSTQSSRNDFRFKFWEDYGRFLITKIDKNVIRFGLASIILKLNK
jgi:hypothetical protein